MPGLKDLSSVWKNIKEIDLKPIRDSATHPIRIAIIGAQGAGRHTLADQMRADPARPGTRTQTAIVFPELSITTEAPAAHLIVIIADATRPDFSIEQALAKKWIDAGMNILVLINKTDLLNGTLPLDTELGWQASRVLYGSAIDIEFLQREFVPAMLELLPQQHLALGRQFPLFRVPISKQLINDTCFSNAAYSFSTGLAEIVPVLDIPLNVTDMIILTKSQAFLAYKLGLLVGFSTSWQDYITEFGSVIGGGFLWRQVARQLVGLIPAWGIIPKVAIAYSGTYVVGHAVLSWYLTGKHLSPQQLRALSTQAFSRGKDVARRLGERFPRPRFKKRSSAKQLEPKIKPELGEVVTVISSENEYNDTERIPGQLLQLEETTAPTNSEHKKPMQRKRLIGQKRSKIPESNQMRTCPDCGRSSSADAGFCQYCGKKFDD